MLSRTCSWVEQFYVCVFLCLCARPCIRYKQLTTFGQRSYQPDFGVSCFFQYYSIKNKPTICIDVARCLRYGDHNKHGHWSSILVWFIIYGWYMVYYMKIQSSGIMISVGCSAALGGLLDVRHF